MCTLVTIVTDFVFGHILQMSKLEYSFSWNVAHKIGYRECEREKKLQIPIKDK